MNMRCERCPAVTTGYNLHDYCATCSRNLCDACMAKGCCGEVPAKSGNAEDHAEEDNERRARER